MVIVVYDPILGASIVVTSRTALGLLVRGREDLGATILQKPHYTSETGVGWILDVSDTFEPHVHWYWWLGWAGKFKPWLRLSQT